MPTDTTAAAGAALRLARSRLMLTDAFLATASLHLDLRAMPLEWWQRTAPWTQPTAATDGQTLFYYPEFVLSLPPDERLYLLAHEVMHCVRGDAWRGLRKQPQVWNMAADFSLNNELAAAGWMLSAASSCQGWKPATDSSEEIYHKLLAGAESMRSAGGFGMVISPRDAMGRELDADATARRAEALEREWRTVVKQAAETAREAGTLHGSYARLLDAVMEPKVPWQEVLRRFVRDARARRGDDYQWLPPRRRALHRGMILPDIERIGMGTLAVLMDLSGSIGDAIAAQFVAEVQAIRAEACPEQTLVLYFDTEVARVDDLGPEDRFDLENVEAAEAGGGTDLDAGFRELERMGVRPQAVIVLTDLYGPFGADRGWPVVWAVIEGGGERVPWGEMVRIGD